MIDFIQLRNAIFAGLNDYLDCLVVEANQAQTKPPYPYMTILFSGPFEAGSAHTGNIYIGDNGPDDVDLILAKDQIMALSLTAICETGDQAQQYAVNAAEWFHWQGEQHLKNSGIVVVGSGAITNRDIALIEDFERRVGFDVQLRVLSLSSRKESWIGQIKRTRKDQTVEPFDLNKKELL